MSERTGFLEEAPGVRSMARLAVGLMTAAVVLLIVALAAYLIAAKWLTGAAPDAGVITAVGAPVVGLTGGIWGALRERAGDTPTPTGGAHAGD